MKPASRVLDAVCMQHWAITEEWLHTIIGIADRSHADLQAVATARGEALANTAGATMREGVAVLPVRGPIFRYANVFTEVSSATSLDVLATDFGQAVANPAVRAIVLEVDSPGGMSAGISEFAAQVREATKTKPVIAYVSDLGASAAYWIASAAGSLVISDTARVGSIGVVLQASRDAGDGTIKITSSQSPFKQVRPDSEAGQRLYQAQIDQLAEVFISAVASYRGVTRAKVISDFGQGFTLVGASAVAAGMADRIGSLESIIAGLAGAQPPRGTPMAESTRVPAVFSEDQVRAEYRASPALQAEFRREDVYVAFMRAEAAGAQQRTPRSAAPREQASQRAPAAEGGRGPLEEPQSADEASCRAEYDADATLRADFPTFTSYLAYARAYHSGRVRVVARTVK